MSTMSSVENNANFNPSWINSAYRGGNGMGGGDRVVSRVLGVTDEKDYPLAPPVFVEHRYGREDLLALVGKDSRPPEGLERCEELYVEGHQPPVSISQLSEREAMMIQNNINSSKAMSSLSPAERAQVASASGGGGTSNSGFQRPGAQLSGGGGGWTPVKGPGWARGNATSRGAGRGSFAGGTGFTGRGGMSGGSTAPNQQPGGGGVLNEDGTSPYGQRYVPRNARGAPPTGRGGSTAAPSFNTRAQGLYNPKDPKDRPRARLRSTSEDDVQNLNGGTNPAGWQPMRVGGARNDENGGNNGWGNRRHTAEGGDRLPEWLNSDDEDPIIEKIRPMSNSRDPIDERNNAPVSGNLNASNESKLHKEEIDRDQRPAWARQVSATGLVTSTAQQDAMLDRGLERALQQAATTSAAPTSSNYPFDQGIFSRTTQHSTSPPRAPAPPAVPPKFYYMDPTKVERGPFEKEQMEQWFKIGYFETSLMLRRETDREFKSLGELQVINGATTPFDFKAPSPPPPQPPASMAPQFSQMAGWNAPGDLGSYMYGSAQGTFNNPAMLRQQFEQETQRRLLIQQEELLQRIMTEQREKEEQQRLELLAREEQLRAYQEEIQRREALMKETAKEMEARLEMERLQLEEQAKVIERERQRVAAIEEAKRREDEEKKRTEDERARKETERRRIEEEQERRRIEEEQRKKRAELAAEAERKRLEVAAREAIAQLKQKEDADKVKKQEAEREAERQRFQVTEDWEVAGKPKREEKKDKTKVTPWSSAATTREKTMAEIMEEEERQAAAERRQIDALRKEELRSHQSLQSAGTWSNAANRISAAAPKTRPSSSSNSSVWGSVSAEPARVNPLLDGPSLISANKVAPAPPKKAPPPKSTPAPPMAKQKPAAPSLQQWAIARMKQLDGTVDADVLYSFVVDVDSPAEVEDYVVGYLGESKNVKEFVKEFIKKRSDAKGGKKTETTTSVNSGSSEWATAQQTGKKKKGKGRTLVVDGSCLGFTPAGDPNRPNKGEIDVPQPAPARR